MYARSRMEEAPAGACRCAVFAGALARGPVRASPARGPRDARALAPPPPRAGRGARPSRPRRIGPASSTVTPTSSTASRFAAEIVGRLGRDLLDAVGNAASSARAAASAVRVGWRPHGHVVHRRSLRGLEAGPQPALPPRHPPAAARGGAPLFPDRAEVTPFVRVGRRRLAATETSGRSTRGARPDARRRHRGRARAAQWSSAVAARLPAPCTFTRVHGLVGQRARRGLRALRRARPRVEARDRL